jgi:NADPH-dependent 2,4-dienoyl-CoA reductase/sulfur reductase-like enzyme/rhodanese-related sulfurtransferase
MKGNLTGSGSDRIFTVRNVSDIDRIKAFIEKKKPKSAVIVGGGFIGIEMAENLKQAGLSVSLIELADQILTPLDIDTASDVQHYLRRQGISLYLGSALKEVSSQKSGLILKLQSGGLNADMLVLAVGIRPESGLAADAELKLNAHGGIVVNKHMQTSDPDIFAVGDAVEVTDFVSGQTAMIPLAGPANKQGRIAADNISGIPSEYTGTQGALVLKVFDMTVAATGLNEKTAKKLGLNYDKIFLWLTGHAGYYPDTKQMSLKVIFEKNTGKILGAQIAGFDGVDKRCDVLSVAIRAGMTAYDLTRLELCYAPPYSSAKDPVNMAGFVIENVLTGRVKNFHWHDVDSLKKDGSITLLDVRTHGEVLRGKIDGFLNIPVDELRKNIGKLDKTKPVYAHCHSGLRSYIASRILEQNGFTVYNLSGGFRLYNSVKNN